MKATCLKFPPVQRDPYSITIEFDNKRQLDTFGSLFNYSPIAEFICDFGGINSETIYKAVKQAGGDIHLTEEFERKLKILENVRRERGMKIT